MINKRVITRAAKKLDLRDISLHSSSFTRNDEADPALYPHSIEKVTKIQVRSDELSFKDINDKEILIFRVFVNFDLIGFVTEESSVKNLFSINTVYRIDYAMAKVLTAEEMREFSLFNTVHNAWPFWRQHIHYIATNANLPRITIPLFRNTGANKPDKKSRRQAVTGKKAIKRLGVGDK